MTKDKLESGMKVRFTIDYYLLTKRLKTRSWYGGYYMYEIKAIGYKWVKLKAHGRNYKMPKDVWDDLIKTNRFGVWIGKNNFLPYSDLEEQRMAA